MEFVMKNRLTWFITLSFFVSLFGQTPTKNKSSIFLGLDHYEGTTDIDISRNEDYILTCSSDQTVKLWEAETGRLVRTFTGHTGEVKSVSFTPDTRTALSASEDKTTKLWDLTTGEILYNWIHPVEVEDATIVQHGYAALTVDKKLTLRKWEIRSGETISEMTLSSQELETIKNRIDEIRSQLNADDYDKRPQGERLKRLEKEIYVLESNAKFERAFLADNGKVALATYEDGTVRVWQTSDGRMMQKLQLYDHEIAPRFPGTDWPFFWQVSFSIREISENGRYVAFTINYENFQDPYQNKLLEIWDTTGGERIIEFKPDGDYDYAVAFIPNTDLVYVSMLGFPHCFVETWDLKDKRKIDSDQSNLSEDWEADIYGFGRLKSFADGERFFGSGYLTGRSITWDRLITKPLVYFGNQTKNMDYFEIMDDGVRGLSVSDIRPHFWDLETGGFINRGLELGSNDIATSRDGRWAVTADEDSIALFDLKQNRLIRVIKPKRFLYGDDPYLDELKMTPDGTKFVTLGGYGPLILWDFETGNELWRINETKIRNENFSITDSHLVLCTENETRSGGKQWLVDIENGTFLFPFENSDYDHMHFLNEAETIAIVDSGFVVWDLNNGNIKQKYYALDEENRRLLHFISDVKYDVFYSSSTKIAAIINGKDIIVWDIVKGGMIHRLHGHTSSIRNVYFTRDGARIISADFASNIRVWDVQKGLELAHTVLLESEDWDAPPEWVTITPQGYFNASKNGARHLFVSKDLNVYSIDQFFEEFYRPDLVAEAISGKEIQVDRDLTSGFATPPKVEIVSPEPGQTFETDVIDVVVRAEDTGGGVDEVRLYHNGKAVLRGNERGIAVKSTPGYAYKVHLLEGENLLRAVGFSHDRTESNPYELSVHLKAADKEVSMHLLAVGLNAYLNPALNLNFAVPDASAVVGFFQGEGQGLFKNVNVTELYDNAATGEAVRAALKGLETSNPQDVVMIYLAGHGESVGHSLYFLPFEVTYPEREEEVKTKGISSEEIAEYIKGMNARKVLLVMDACKAGTALLAFRGFSDRRALLQLARATGVHVIAASTKDQFAAEVEVLGHGIFTHALLQGLSGMASEEGPVTVRGLLGYVESQLPILSEKYRQQPQFPVADSRGMDFPLVIK